MKCSMVGAMIIVTLCSGCTSVNSTDFSADDQIAYAEAIQMESALIAQTTTTPAVGQQERIGQPTPPLRPNPTLLRAAASHGHTHTPDTVINEANHNARQTPDAHGYYNAIMTYDYDPGALYRVYAAPLQLTDIQLQPGERMVSQPASGDTTRWKVAASLSVENGVERQHLLITPKRPDIYTSLVIPTDRRTYHLELFSYEETYMAAVKWNYADDTLLVDGFSLLNSNVGNTGTEPASIDLNNANFAYQIRPIDGDPVWTPQRVFDDGVKTYVQFPDALTVSDAPALFVKKYGTPQLVNYRAIGRFYVVDGVFARYELRVGSERDWDIVEILNENADRPR